MIGIDNPRFIDLDKKYFIPYFSYSQLNSYRNCPQTFKKTYLGDRFKSNGNKYTKLGNVLHDIFERQGKQLIAEGEPFTKGQAYKQFNKEFIKVKNEHLEYFDDKDDFIKMYQKGIVAIDNFYEVYKDAKPLFVEKKFLAKIAEGLPMAKSFIDRIDGDDPEDASTWIISDYKTGGAPKAKAYLREDFQMGLYVAQVYAQYGKYPKAVQFVHPVPNKTQTALHQGDGVYKFQGQREPVVEFSIAETITLVRNTIADIIDAKEKDHFPLVPDKWGCKFCWFFQDGSCKPFEGQQGGWHAI